MKISVQNRSFLIFVALVGALAILTATNSTPAASYTTKPFSGKVVNGGTATYSNEGNKRFLTLSDDFKVPGTPDPHWQVVDSSGRIYLLDRLPLKDGRIAKRIQVPSYIMDIAKVQIWCSYAEALLGEAPFEKPVK